MSFTHSLQSDAPLAEEGGKDPLSWPRLEFLAWCCLLFICMIVTTYSVLLCQAIYIIISFNLHTQLGSQQYYPILWMRRLKFPEVKSHIYWATKPRFKLRSDDFGAPVTALPYPLSEELALAPLDSPGVQLWPLEFPGLLPSALLLPNHVHSTPHPLPFKLQGTLA